MVLRALSDLVLPPRCASCDAWGATPLCVDCERKICWIEAPSCSRCGAPMQTDRACRSCIDAPPNALRAQSAAVYSGPVRDALMTFKLAGERRAANVFARWLTAPAARLRKPDAICWVPSSRAALAMRGFDPARQIAVAFAELVGMRAVPLVRKIRETADQAGLDRDGRRANLDGAFDVPVEAPPTVILVDDILTTGATACACTKALEAAGAVLVQALTVARVL